MGFKSKCIKIDTQNYHFDEDFIQKKCDEAYELNKENIDALIKCFAKK